MMDRVAFSVSVNVITIALMAVMLIGIILWHSRKKLPQDRLLIVLLLISLAGAALDAFDTVIESVDIACRIPLIMAGHTLHNITTQLFLYLIFLYVLIHYCGKKDISRKQLLVFAIPACFSLLLLIANLPFGFLFRIDPATLAYEHAAYYHLLDIATMIYLLVSMVLLFRVNWNTGLILGILILLRVHFVLVISDLGITNLTLALAITLLVMCVRIRGILVEVGSILGLLFLIVIVVITNYLTCASFTSYLMTRKDQVEFSLKGVEKAILDYDGLNWAIDYWKEHPDEIVLNFFEDFDSEKVNEWVAMTEYLHESNIVEYGEITNITSEILEQLPEKWHMTYANAVYTYLFWELQLQLSEEKVNDLYLVQMNLTGEDPIVLIDGSAEGNESSYKLGDKIPFETLAELRNRFTEATRESELNWGWLTYSMDDKFGILYQIGDKYADQGLVLISTISMRDISQSLGYIRGFRIQAVVFLILIAVLMLLILRFTVLSPLEKVQKSVLEYQRDKDANKVQQTLSTVPDHNEIGVLAGQFSSLTREMDRYTEQIAVMASERERTEYELSLATSIQMNALSTDFPDRPEFSLRASMIPARDVGGDFYDFFEIDEDHLALVIADVSDKGVPAALFMMSAQIMLSERTRAGGTPAEILSSVNEKLCEKSPMTEMFVTVWLGILEISTGRMVCANAGHEFPAIRSGSEGFRLIKDRHGMVLGGIEGSKYHDYEIMLAPGDAVFVYTDGVPEANNEDGEFYGPERMEASLRKENDTMDPAMILKRVQEDLGDFVAGAVQFDDTTMLCLIYKGKV
ncbi:MAG: serine/threonine-protein phosphatase [Lachnospiraceae bacterium]|nr:serine/threonine-protein phosphatase [Lachnospiraceae bacterium]